LTRGIQLERAGDSIRIVNNTITGAGIGIQVDHNVGSGSLIISGNNMTPDGPAIQILSGYRAMIIGNLIEPPPAGGNYPGVPFIDMPGPGGGVRVTNPLLIGNTFYGGGVANTDAIHMDWVQDAMIDFNNIYSAGAATGVVCTANTLNPKINNAGISWTGPGTHVTDASGTAQVPLWVDMLAGRIVFPGVLFAALGAPANGQIVYCSNCTIASPCAGGGNGAIAKRLNGIWVCN
jgi:hypothetical protein